MAGEGQEALENLAAQQAAENAVSRLDPTGRVIRDPQVPHGTYPVQLGGLGYSGRLAVEPQQVVLGQTETADGCLGL
jgi:hypothetical protein